MPQISPASRPIFSGALTPTPTSSNSGWRTISGMTIRPTKPVPQTTTFYAAPGPLVEPCRQATQRDGFGATRRHSARVSRLCSGRRGWTSFREAGRSPWDHRSARRRGRRSARARSHTSRGHDGTRRFARRARHDRAVRVHGPDESHEVRHELRPDATTDAGSHADGVVDPDVSGPGSDVVRPFEVDLAAVPLAPPDGLAVLEATSICYRLRARQALPDVPNSSPTEDPARNHRATCGAASHRRTSGRSSGRMALRVTMQRS